MKKNRVVFVIICLWLFAAVFGIAILWNYDTTAGKLANAPSILSGFSPTTKESLVFGCPLFNEKSSCPHCKTAMKSRQNKVLNLYQKLRGAL